MANEAGMFHKRQRLQKCDVPANDSGTLWLLIDVKRAQPECGSPSFWTSELAPLFALAATGPSSRLAGENGGAACRNAWNMVIFRQRARAPNGFEKEL